mmetsp:Transcript_2459/g.11159  ORF Transcript_2459/g.11159 Transcript_2459/m.11159 type:complete len:278 (+) Transcript_2459:719-1552(+)
MIPTRPWPHARSKILSIDRLPVRSHVARNETATLNASTLSTISFTRVYLPANTSIRRNTRSSSGKPSHASDRYRPKRARNLGSRSNSVVCVLRQLDRIGKCLSSDSVNGAFAGSARGGGAGGGAASSPCVPAMNASSIASPTSVVHFIGRSPPSVFFDGVRRSSPSSRVAADAAASIDVNVNSANPRWSRPRSRLSLGRAGPNVAICIRVSSPSTSSSDPSQCASMISTNSIGSTSVGRLPTRMRGFRGLPSMACVSSGSPKPGAAARHPLPLNTFL